ncbi:hypothetical protein [Rhodococcus rhodochrous]|uniref:hypothetical protein n=2 Tax=Nocardiaceae TaxID=85025 RepID=UPI00035C0E81|nr:hypothetical protein [Rhodococcus rhodochrous]
MRDLTENCGWPATSHPADEQDPRAHAGPVGDAGGFRYGHGRCAEQLGEDPVQGRECHLAALLGAAQEQRRHGDRGGVGDEHPDRRGVQMAVVQSEHEVPCHLSEDEEQRHRKAGLRSEQTGGDSRTGEEHQHVLMRHGTARDCVRGDAQGDRDSAHEDRAHAPHGFHVDGHEVRILLSPAITT